MRAAVGWVPWGNEPEQRGRGGMPEGGGGDRMAVLQLLQTRKIDSDQGVALLRALAEAGAGRTPDTGAESRAAAVRMLGAGRIDVDEALSLLQALAEAGVGELPDLGGEECVSVLRMLEEGQIQAEDAVSLIRALRDRNPGGEARGPRGGFRRGTREAFRRGETGDSSAGPGPEQWERATQRAMERARRAAEFWSQQAEEIAERAGKAAEQVGENMGRVLSGVPDMVERMARAGWGNWGPGHRFEEMLEGTIPPGGEATLDVEGWNGPVSVRAVDGDRVRIILRKTVHAPSEDAAREIAMAVEAFVEPDARRVRVGRRQGGGAWPGGLAVEAYVPRGVTWTGEARTGNGPVDVDGLRVNGLRLETSNGPVRVLSCQGEDIAVTTSNGRIEVEGALAGRTELRTSNGAIAVAPSGEGGGETAVRAVTSNGAIEVRLPPTVAVEIDAATSNGRFDLSGLGPEGPNLGNQKGFGRSEVRWRAPSWDQAPARLRLALRPSNGGVRVL